MKERCSTPGRGVVCDTWLVPLKYYFNPVDVHADESERTVARGLICGGEALDELGERDVVVNVGNVHDELLSVFVALTRPLCQADEMVGERVGRSRPFGLLGVWIVEHDPCR